MITVFDGLYDISSFPNKITQKLSPVFYTKLSGTLKFTQVPLLVSSLTLSIIK